MIRKHNDMLPLILDRIHPRRIDHDRSVMAFLFLQSQ
jgi:hypothetical protein